MTRVKPALSALLLAASAFAAERNLIEGIVVRVNDRILTTRDMNKRMIERAAEMGQAVPAEEIPAFVDEIADELCLLERAAELKIEVASEELDQALKGLREENRLEDDAAFEAMLRTTGLSAEQLRNRVRDTILVRRVLGHEMGSLPITEEELRQLYERHKDSFMVGERVQLEHLVVAVSGQGSDRGAKRAQLERLAAAARADGNFTALVAAEVAAGRGSGGDLGEVMVSDLRPEVRSAVEKLSEGEISAPFESSLGIHIARLVKRLPAAPKPFESVVDQLRDREMARRYRERLSGVVSGLKERYVVETHAELMTRP